MTFLEAALQILRREGKSLHFKEITDKAVSKSLLTFVGRSPEVTMQTQLTSAVKKSPGNPFVRVKPGTFGLLRYPELSDEEKAEVENEKETAKGADKEGSKEGSEARDSDDARSRRRRRGRRGRSRRGDEGDSETAAEAADAAEQTNDSQDSETSENLSMADKQELNSEASTDASTNGATDEAVGATAAAEPDETASAPAADTADGKPGETAEVRAEDALDSDKSDENDDEAQSASSDSGDGSDDDAGNRRRRRRRRRRRGGSAEGAEGEGAEASSADADSSQGEASENDDTESSEEDAKTIFSPLDAAVEVLRGQNPGRGVHVRQIAESAVRKKLIHGEPHEAWRLMRTALAADGRERLRNGLRPRVRSAGSGLYALARRPADMDLEKAEHVFSEAKRALHERTAASLEKRLQELGGSAFEALGRVLLQREGFGPATFVKRVEGTVYLETLRGRGWRPSKCLVALRPGGTAAGRRAIGELRAGVRARGLDEGMLLLAGRLSEEAIKEWKQSGPPIEVADGPALADVSMRHGVGVINTSVAVNFVDADFFAELAEG